METYGPPCIDVHVKRVKLNCTNQQPPQRGGAVPDLFDLSQTGCWPFRGSQLPRAPSSHKPFFRCATP